jgi:ubiquitin carboxyl-terminal hydrolase 5/13
MRKTEKSMAELQVDLNVRFEFDAVTEGGGGALVALRGPGHVGLQNLGNSCYMASVMQLLFSVPEFAARYGAGAPPAEEEGAAAGGDNKAEAPPPPVPADASNARRVLEAALAAATDPTSDLPAQLAKLGLALTAARTGAPPPLAKFGGSGDEKGGPAPMEREDEEDDPQDAQERNSVRPAMFKALVGRGHAEFSSARQQDAAEFWSHVLGLVERAERAHGGLVALPTARSPSPSSPRDALPTASLFQFVAEYRTECAETGAASYRRDPPAGALALDVPLEAATNAREVAESRERAERRRKLREAEAGAYIGVGGGGGGTGAAGAAEKNDDGAPNAPNAPTANPAPAPTAPTTAAAQNNDAKTVVLTADEPDEPPVLPRVPLAACLAHYAAPSTVDDVRSAAAGGRRVRARRTARLATLPPFLLVHVKRFFLAADWTPRKLEVELDVPDELDLEEVLRGRGPAAGERMQPEEDDEGAAKEQEGAGAAAAAAPAPAPVARAAALTPDPALVATVTGMGFGEHAARRGALAAARAAEGTGVPASAEAAMEWVLAHMDDPDVNDPLPEEGGAAAGAGDGDAPAAAAAPAAAVAASIDPEAAASLAAMGFSDAQAHAALLATGGSLERAADWLFSHADGLDAAVAEVEQQQQQQQQRQGASGGNGGGGGGGGNGGGGSSNNNNPLAAAAVVDGPGRYRLVGFVSHVGASAACGHYVAHVRKRGRWVIFNDEKVAASKAPPRAQGYLYLYARVAGGGEERVVPVAEATAVPKPGAAA